MKADLSTWIYLILGIAVTIWSASQKKKAQQAETQNKKVEDEPGEPSTFDPWSEILFPEIENAKKQPNIEPEVQKNTQTPKTASYSTEILDTPVSKYENPKEWLDKVPSKNKVETEGESQFKFDHDLDEMPPVTAGEVHDYLSDFDAKKAIIYQEIMNRKYA
jgi:hypothetical protein